MENNNGNYGNNGNDINENYNNYNNYNGNNNNNNNNYAEEYHVNPEPEPEPMNSEVLPVAMQSNMLRMLYELRVPLYALGALAGGGGGGGAYDDDDAEQQAIEVLARSLYDIRPVKRVIDVGEDGEGGKKHGIREMTYDPETAEELKINTACGIWQEEFEKGQAIKVLPCNHAFQADAITKWLTTEKAECPICRFKLESKEVIVHPSAGDDNDMPRLMSDDSDTDNEDDEAEESQPRPPAVNEQRAMENNMMYRQNNNIYSRAHGGGAADMGREYYYGVSAPMNRLLQMRAGLINGARARVGGGAAHAGPQHQPIQPSQASQASRSQPNNSIMHINNINNYFISPANNNINQEQADIEEAIRRSLE